MNPVERGKEIADTLRKLGSKGMGYPSPGSERKMLVAYITHLEEDNTRLQQMMEGMMEGEKDE